MKSVQRPRAHAGPTLDPCYASVIWGCSCFLQPLTCLLSSPPDVLILRKSGLFLECLDSIGVLEISFLGP